jgi:DNA-binding NarL/FixJ family response regulator
VTSVAQPGEVLISSTVKDLLNNPALHFESRGPRTLKGVPGRWRLYAVSGDQPNATGRSQLPSVLVVDDHPLWRQTLRTILQLEGAASSISEAGNGEEAIAAIATAPVDLVLLDMDLPRMHGIEATRVIIAQSPSTRVLVLSSSDDQEQVVEAVRAGASGYLLKTADTAQVIDGVRRVHAGELVFPAVLAGAVLAELRGRPQSRAPSDPLADLSDREREVISLMAEGLTNEVIGERLHVSMKTIEGHATTIFAKLGLDGAAGGHRRVLAVIAYLKAASDSQKTHRKV